MRRCTELVLGLFALLAGCETDHDALARRPPQNQAGEGGAAGSLGGSGGTSAGTGGSSGTAGTGGTKVVEPPGRSVVTFVHGIVDAERVLLCFAQTGDEGPSFEGSPLPEDGLAYGASLSFETLPNFSVTETVRVFAIAGELDRVEGENCEDAVELARAEMRAAGDEPSFLNLAGAGGVNGAEGGAAGDAAGAPSGAAGDTGGAGGSSAEAGAAGEGAGGVSSGGNGGASSAGETGSGGVGGAAVLPDPPRLRVAELPSLPAGAIVDGYSLLYAANGCIGGPAFSHALEEQVCGAGYSPKNPTLGAELVSLSRKVNFLNLSLQALHSSRALGRLDLRTRPAESSTEFAQSIASSLTLGSLQPRAPRSDLRSEQLGISDGGGLEFFVDGVSQWVGSWNGVTRLSAVTPINGRVYTLVVIGPAVAEDSDGFWNAPTVTLVDNDPELQ
jgi:hypothetical protein